MLLPFAVPPGVYKNGTEYQSKGRWNDSDLVRWFEGTLRPVGGWRQLIGGSPRAPLQITGAARGSHAWRSNDSDPYLAIGTHTNLYARVGRIGPLKDITPAGLLVGFADTQANTAYSGGAYGYESYGTPRTEVQFSDMATTWSMDNFGAFLLGVQSQDGRLFYWDLVAATAVPVVATAGAVPTNNTGVIVTDERFVMLLQAGGNRRRIAWSDQENLFNWQVTSTTQAGDFELQTAGEIMAAVKTRGQTLFLTSVDAHISTYLGPPLVYGFERVGTGCGVISRNAAVATDNAVVWMGQSTFHIYDGFVQDLPSDVSDYVFGRINRDQAAKVWVEHNPAFNEITWYYPAGMEVDSYVTYNYVEKHWAVGSMVRTTGVNATVFPNPVRVGIDGFVYEHEVGFFYDNRTPFAESGPIELGTGDRVYMAKYIYPDEKTQGDVQARFATKFYPNGAEFDKGPYSLANPTSIRFTSRQAAMRIEGVKNVDWRVGIPRLEVEPGGLR